MICALKSLSRERRISMRKSFLKAVGIMLVLAVGSILTLKGLGKFGGVEYVFVSLATPICGIVSFLLLEDKRTKRSQ